MIKSLLNKTRSTIGYILYLVAVIVFVDVVVFQLILGMGYPSHYEQENIERYPAPFVEFAGKPGTRDHNEYGFRGASLAEAGPDDLRIAFFAGSTGYLGDPPIAKIVEAELERRLGRSVFVANFSVVSSNHRQHLHGILEYLPAHQPDVVVFYGGYNETVQNGYYDPRPGYPYDFFYRAETSPFLKVLIENSGMIGALDQKNGFFSGLGPLRRENQPFSEAWYQRIADKYLETLLLASRTARALDSKEFGNPRFFAFCQPYQAPDTFAATHEEIRRRVAAAEDVFDVSAEYDRLGKEVYTDIVHVRQSAREVKGGEDRRHHRRATPAA